VTDVDPRLKGKDGFKNWLWLCWQALGLPAPTPVQYDIADWISNGPRRVVCQAFRGIGKSYITSAYVVWRLMLDPSLSFLVISASKNRSDDFSTFSLKLIEELGPLAHHLRPKEGQRCSKIAFDVGGAPPAHAPSVTSKGVFSSVTGARADEVIVDDASSWANSQTQMMRDKLFAATQEYEAILKPGGRIIYLGTPQTEHDLLHELPNRGFKTRIWPARYPNDRQLIGYGDRLAPMIAEMPEPAGSPVEPSRFSDQELVERELAYGRSMFSMQFMLDQSLSDIDRYPLKINDLIVSDLDPEFCFEKYVHCNDPDKAWTDLPCVGMAGDRFYRPLMTVGDQVKYETCVLAIDPSGRGEDLTAYAAVASYAGQLMVLECGGIKGGFDPPVLEELAQIAKRTNARLCLVEANLGGGMFSSLLQPYLRRIYRCPIEEVTHSIQKEKRICDVLEPVLNSHSLVLNRSIILKDQEGVLNKPLDQQRQYQLLWQLSRIQRIRGALRHDDQLDALAMACQYFSDFMAKDTDREMKTRKDAAHEDMLRDYLEHGPMKTTLGAKPVDMVWQDSGL
jgi:hypothetical protein